tara:strand:+ start:2672 stop:3376 length:705 start_codon:yes stop_codon:yes gene_type:complete
VTTLQVAILAGGRGERLGELTQNTPKPLLPVAGEPFIAHLLVRLARAGLTQVGILTGPFDDIFHSVLGTGSDYGVELSLIPEPEPAGTGGALRYIADRTGEEFICMNGDSLFDIDYLALSGRTLDRDSDFDICLRQLDDTKRYGRVELDDTGRVTRFGEKESSGPGLVNTGIYRIRSEIISQLPPRPASLETEILPALVKRQRVTGRVHNAPFLDIGIPSDFARASAFVKDLPT